MQNAHGWIGKASKAGRGAKCNISEMHPASSDTTEFSVVRKGSKIHKRDLDNWCGVKDAMDTIHQGISIIGSAICPVDMHT